MRKCNALKQDSQGWEKQKHFLQCQKTSNNAVLSGAGVVL